MTWKSFVNIELAIAAMALVIGTSTASLAANEPSKEQEITGGTKLVISRVVPKSFLKYETPSDAEIEAIVQSISQINADYGRHFTLPQTLEIWVLSMIGFDGSGVSAANYDPIENLLTTGAAFSYRQDGEEHFRQTTQKTLPITIHEYGHVIFYENLKKIDPQFKAVIDLKREGNEIASKENSLRSDSPHCYPVIVGEHERKAECEKIDQEISRLEAQREALSEKIEKDVIKLFTILPYGELFADTVAVLETGNLDTILDVLQVSGYSLDQPTSDYIHLRSFTKCPPAAGFAGEMEPHTFFAPARCIIGQMIKSKMVRNFDKSSFLKSIFEVLANDFRNLKGGIEIDQDSEAANMRVIRALEEIQ